MRPKSIVQFEQVYGASVLLGVLASLLLLTRPGTIAVPLNAPPAVVANMPLIALASLALGIGLGLLFLYFIARRGSTVAKWLFVIVVAIGLLMMLSNVARGTAPASLLGLIGLVQAVLQLIAIYLLFRPDSEAWFRARRG